jgi:trk system potassium uptake protein TrkA
MKRQVCVVGLGRFGSTIAKEFYQAGHDVLAIDTNEERIQAMLGLVTYAVKADATNEATLRELGLAEFDVAAIALGSENMQSSIMITVTLKSMNIPHIIARAGSEIHGETLGKIGADKIVYPEIESARRVARVDFNDNILDYMEIAPNAGISKIRPPKDMYNLTIEDAGLGGKNISNGVSVLAMRRGRNYILNPSKDEEIKIGDLLIITGRTDQIEKLSANILDNNPKTS